MFVNYKGGTSKTKKIYQLHLNMKNFTRKKFLKLLGLAGLTSISGSFFNQLFGKDIENNIIEDDENSIKNITQLPDTGTWPTSDPFLFCVHHHDVYPSANQNLGPKQIPPNSQTNIFYSPWLGDA